MKNIFALLIAIILLGCQDKGPTGKKAPEQQQQPAATVSLPSAAPQSPAPAPHVTVTGVVLEKIDVTGGMYLRLKTPTGEVWAAVDKADLKKGAEVTVINAIPMDGFESKALKRTFDHIVFGSLAAGAGTTAAHAPMAAGASAAPAGADRMTEESKRELLAKMHPDAVNPPEEKGTIKIKKAEGAEGKTVAEIFAAQASLKDAPVAVRGKVVKYNTGIMGKNWLHLRDGSGSPEKNDFDITVTTTDAATLGDTVLVKGKVRLDRDFGAGYTYPVIIEDAKVSK